MHTATTTTVTATTSVTLTHTHTTTTSTCMDTPTKSERVFTNPYTLATAGKNLRLCRYFPGCHVADHFAKPTVDVQGPVRTTRTTRKQNFHKCTSVAGQLRIRLSMWMWARRSVRELEAKPPKRKTHAQKQQDRMADMYLASRIKSDLRQGGSPSQFVTNWESDQNARLKAALKADSGC